MKSRPDLGEPKEAREAQALAAAKLETIFRANMSPAGISLKPQTWENRRNRKIRSISDSLGIASRQLVEAYVVPANLSMLNRTNWAEIALLAEKSVIGQ